MDHLAVRATGAGAVAVDVGAAVSLAGLAVRSADGACLRSAATGVRIEASDFTQTAAAAEPCLQTSGDDTDWAGVRVAAPGGAAAAAFAGNGRVVDGVFSGAATGLRADGPGTVRRVTARGSAYGLVVGGSVTVTDSVAVARGGGTAVLAAGADGQLLNLTARATGPGSEGIRATDGATVFVRNTIARGAAFDIAATPAPPGCGCADAVAAVDHSNFRTAAGITDGGGNQAGAPRFADPAGGDLRLRPGSPAVDAGAFLFNAGSADRDGRARWLGAAPDIGAYEQPPAPRRPDPGRDVRPPRITHVQLHARRFTARAGTLLEFTLYEPADLVVVVSRRGRRGATVGTLVRQVPFGRVRVRVRGALDGRRLRPGRYVLSVLARDRSQNLSRARRFAVTVVRPRRGRR